MANILLVHDKHEWVERFKEVLAPPHVVTTCENFISAIGLLKESELADLERSSFDLVLAGVHVDTADRLSVFDLLKWTRNNAASERLPFVLVCLEPTDTALYLTDAVREAGNALRASGYLMLENLDEDATKVKAEVEKYLPPEPERAAADKRLSGGVIRNDIDSGDK